MAPILVTGATGFVGWHVARNLIERGHRVRALARPGRTVPELDVEHVTGDLRDADSLRRAVQGCRTVFHVAADYRLWTRHPQEMYDSNVGGTRNILTAARDGSVERVVYTSTVGCIGWVRDGLGHEQTPVSIDAMQGAYKRSKFQAEQVALEFAHQGLDVVIVNPTAPIGDHDFRPTPTGRIVADFLAGRMPAFVETGLNVVNVRDCALGHLLAWERGRRGERYILGSENLSLEQILRELAALTGRKAPTTKVPYAVAYAYAALSEVAARFTGITPQASRDAVRMSQKPMYVTHAKAAQELGYQPGPAREGLRLAAEWFQSRARS